MNAYIESGILNACMQVSVNLDDFLKQVDDATISTILGVIIGTFWTSLMV